MSGQYKDRGQSTFLLLPREIRDRIYEQLLDLEVPAPRSFQANSDRREEYFKRSCIKHARQPLQIPSLGLLSCSHQVSDEMHQAIKHRNDRDEYGIEYKLDLSIWATFVEPTWLSLPVPAKYVKSLNLNIRVFEGNSSGWEGGDSGGHRPLLQQYILDILHRFYVNGPSLSAPSSRDGELVYRNFLKGPDLAYYLQGEHSTRIREPSSNLQSLESLSHLAMGVLITRKRNQTTTQSESHDDPSKFVSFGLCSPCDPKNRLCHPVSRVYAHHSSLQTHLDGLSQAVGSFSD